MNKKVLFVDDDPNILSTFKRNLHKRYQVHTALGPEKGIQTVQSKGPFAVVVSDFRMPEMDGIEFLMKVKKTNSDTVRIMLTGFADLDVSITAVNQGHVFRFLTKPCNTMTLVEAIDAGLEQYRLITSEREFLRGTLRGSVKVLTEILSLTNPEAFGRSERIKRLMHRVAVKMKVKNTWSFDLAAMLSQIGCVSITEDVLHKVYTGQELSPEEKQIYDMHPAVGSNLLSNIPRLETVRSIIEHQEDKFSIVKEIPLGARILKIVLDYDTLIQSGKDKHEALEEMRNRKGWYDPKILEVFQDVLTEEEGFIKRSVKLRELKPGMLLDENVYTNTNLLLMVKGQEISDVSLSRLRSFTKVYGIRQPITVLIPKDKSQQENKS